MEWHKITTNDEIPLEKYLLLYSWHDDYMCFKDYVVVMYKSNNDTYTTPSGGYDYSFEEIFEQFTNWAIFEGPD